MNRDGSGAADHHSSLEQPNGVCPDCGSALQSYRIKYGKPGQWNYSTEEGLMCNSCQRYRVPPARREKE